MRRSVRAVKSRWPLAVVLDALCVVVFVVIGRASHHHGEEVGGVASTLWPFATGTVVGWLALAARPTRRSLGPRRRASGPVSVGSGVTVCVATVGIGMALRVVAGQGTAPSFVAVATGFLGAAMLGWRGVVSVASRRRSSSAPGGLRR